MDSTDTTPRRTRRTFLRTAAGAGAGAAGLAAAGTASAQAASFGGWFSDVPNFDGIVDKRGQDEVTVEVGVDTSAGPYGFGPAAVRIDPGTTINFEWVSNTHNVTIEDQPSGAGWEGVSTIHNTGFSYSHTFETEGVYRYFCEPHRSLGMKAGVVVGDVEVEVPSAGGGGSGGGFQWSAPGDSFAQVFLLAVAALLGVALASVLGAEAVASRRRQQRERAAELPESGEVAFTEEASAAETAREIGHDEYDPTGTAALILVYLLILVVMWLFMYFVEFLGNGPTVIG